MNTNINILTINNYFSRNKEKNNEYFYLQKRKKIVPNSFFSINEVNICHKIKKIPYYSNYYSILDDYELLNISQLNENIIEKVKNIGNNSYYLFQYLDVNSIDFLDYLYNFITIKELIFNIINIFPHIVRGLHILNENGICFFNISPKNMIFLENYREKPVLNNFQLSLRLNRIDFNYISNILSKLDDFIYQPLEIHILFYFVKNDITTISYSFIEEISESFVEKLSILRLFSEKYRKSYKEKCIETMKKYINLPKNEIIDDILDRNDKWDIYGISMLYVMIFGCISRVFSLKDSFMSKITIFLSKNLDPDSEKRMTFEETLYQFDKYLEEQNNWQFVNNLDNNKLESLFDELSK
jgi:hypothetical protein